MKETKAPLVGELSPQVTEGFTEFKKIHLLMLFPNSSNPSDLAVLGHLPYRGGVVVLSFIVVCKHVKIAKPVRRLVVAIRPPKPPLCKGRWAKSPILLGGIDPIYHHAPAL